jgi:excisionase family DNA binding protein
MGRQLKLTPRVQEELCALIKKGCHIEIACRVCGISTSSYYSWLQQGEEERAAREEVTEGAGWITTAEAAELIGRPAATLRKAARDGAFKARKEKRRWLLDREEVLSWAESEPSPYLQFLEAVRQAEAEAEAHLVKSWQEQTPKNWRAARDFLARRFPMRWSERRLIEADVRADARVQADVEVQGEMKVEFTEDEVTNALQRFKEFLKQEAVEAEGMRMDVQDFLSDGESRSLAEIASTIGKEQGRTLKCLQGLAKSGQVRQIEDGKWALTWTPSADDVQDEETPPAEPPPDTSLKPQGPPPRRVPLLAEKTFFAQLRDGEVVKEPFL